MSITVNSNDEKTCFNTYFRDFNSFRGMLLMPFQIYLSTDTKSLVIMIHYITSECNNDQEL